MRYRDQCCQYLPEHDRFLEILKQHDVSSYLEIGSCFGGTFWRVVNSLPKGSKVVAIDFPGSYKGQPTQKELQSCIEELRALEYDAHVFFGDSTRHDIVAAAARLAPYDAVFIDANHTEQYVRTDWMNYNQMATKIIGFHDITRTLIRPGRFPIEVKKVWDEIKPNYAHEEIMLDPAGMVDGVGMHNGIGVLFLENENAEVSAA